MDKAKYYHSEKVYELIGKFNALLFQNIVVAEVYCKSYDLVINSGTGSNYPSPRMAIAPRINESNSNSPAPSPGGTDGTNTPVDLTLADEARASQRDEPLHESDYHQLLLDYIELHGRSHHVLKYAITKEVKSTEEFSQLFRGESFATALVGCFIKSVAFEWARKMLALPVIKAVQQAEHVKVDIFNMSQEAIQFITNSTRTILASIFASVSGCPEPLQVVLNHVRRCVSLKWNAYWNVSVGAIVFLRFICSFLVQPYESGIVPDQITFVARRALILVSKILQNIVNGIQFGDKEQTMVPFNSLVAEFKDQMFHFLDDVSTGKRPRRKTCDAAGFKDITPSKPSMTNSSGSSTIAQNASASAKTSSSTLLTSSGATTATSSHSKENEQHKTLPAIQSAAHQQSTVSTSSALLINLSSPPERTVPQSPPEKRQSKGLPPLPIRTSPRDDKLLGPSLRSPSESNSDETGSSGEVDQSRQATDPISVRDSDPEHRSTKRFSRSAPSGNPISATASGSSARLPSNTSPDAPNSTGAAAHASDRRTPTKLFMQGKRKSHKVSTHVVERLINDASVLSGAQSPLASPHRQHPPSPSTATAASTTTATTTTNVDLTPHVASSELFGLPTAPEGPVVESYLSDDQIIDTFLRIFMDHAETFARELTRAGSEKVATELLKTLTALKREKYLQVVEELINAKSENLELRQEIHKLKSEVKRYSLGARLGARSFYHKTPSDTPTAGLGQETQAATQSPAEKSRGSSSPSQPHVISQSPPTDSTLATSALLQQSVLAVLQSKSYQQSLSVLVSKHLEEQRNPPPPSGKLASSDSSAFAHNSASAISQVVGDLTQLVIDGCLEKLAQLPPESLPSSPNVTNNSTTNASHARFRKRTSSEIDPRDLLLLRSTQLNRELSPSSDLSAGNTSNTSSAYTSHSSSSGGRSPADQSHDNSPVNTNERPDRQRERLERQQRDRDAPTVNTTIPTTANRRSNEKKEKKRRTPSQSTSPSNFLAGLAKDNPGSFHIPEILYNDLVQPHASHGVVGGEFNAESSRVPTTDAEKQKK